MATTFAGPGAGTEVVVGEDREGMGEGRNGSAREPGKATFVTVDVG